MAGGCGGGGRADEVKKGRYMERKKKAPQRDLDKTLCINCCVRLSGTMLGKVSLCKWGTRSQMVH